MLVFTPLDSHYPVKGFIQYGGTIRVSPLRSLIGVMRSRLDVTGCSLQVTSCRNKSCIHRRDAESAKKTILDLNELSKRILGTAIEVLIVRRGATVVIPFCNLCVLCVFAVKNKFLILALLLDF